MNEELLLLLDVDLDLDETLDLGPILPGKKDWKGQLRRSQSYYDLHNASSFCAHSRYNRNEGMDGEFIDCV